jgi:hypothetical protein
MKVIELTYSRMHHFEMEYSTIVGGIGLSENT